MTGLDVVALLVIIAAVFAAIPFALHAMLFDESDHTHERGEQR